VAVLGAVAAGAAAGAGGAEGTPVLCPFRLVLGLPCPFCGLTHSLLAVGQGDLAHAFALNPLGLVVPLAAAALLVALWRSLRSGVPMAWPRPLLVIGIALIALSWTIQLEKGLT
jgi:uncharacterized protein DUF2752